MPINSFKEDEKSVEKSKLATMLRLFSYLLSYKKQVVFVLLIMAYCVLVSLVNPLLIERAMDDAIAKKNMGLLLEVIGIAAALNIIMIILVRVRMLVMAKVCNKVLLTIRQELYTHIQTLDFHFFDSRPTGKILSRIIGDINSLKDVLENCVTTLIPEFITVCAVVVIMLVKSPKLALAGLSTLPLLIIGMFVIQIFSHKRWQVFRKKCSNLNAFLHEDISGMRIVQSLTAEKEMDQTFHVLIGEQMESFNRAVRLNDFFGPMIDICWGIGTIIMFYVGIVIMGPEKVSVGLLVAFGSYIGMFWMPLMNLSNFYNQLITNIAGAERIFEVMDAVPAIQNRENAGELCVPGGAVAFEQVDFAYADAPEIMVLNRVSFAAKPGETIALVGPTGAGKTTIVNLISRFYDVNGGCVKIDGQDVRDVTLHSLRDKMGIMTQDNFLFSGTIRENIRYGRLDATDEEIETAAKAVGAHDFIIKLEKGYDTELSERGGGLSVGQRQLLAFARTFVSNPKILILDEATSSIDTRTALLVQKGIEALLKGRTSFIIAHRLSTIQNADRIFYIDEGGILEQGSPKELMEKEGAYYKLYMAQFAL